MDALEQYKKGTAEFQTKKAWGIACISQSNLTGAGSDRWDSVRGVMHTDVAMSKHSVVEWQGGPRGAEFKMVDCEIVLTLIE